MTISVEWSGNVVRSGEAGTEWLQRKGVFQIEQGICTYVLRVYICFDTMDNTIASQANNK